MLENSKHYIVGPTQGYITYMPTEQSQLKDVLVMPNEENPQFLISNLGSSHIKKMFKKTITLEVKTLTNFCNNKTQDKCPQPDAIKDNQDRWMLEIDSLVELIHLPREGSLVLFNDQIQITLR